MTIKTITVECTAVFPLVQRAKEFVALITEPGWSATDVIQKGRTVTWTGHPTTTEYPDDPALTKWQYLTDMKETVGYCGSDQRRKATLNGNPCPMGY